MQSPIHTVRVLLRSIPTRAAMLLGGVLLIATIPGCSSAGAASDLAYKPRPQVIPPSGAIHLPQDGKLGIALVSFDRHAGISGVVDGDATADADGNGLLRGVVSKGGSIGGVLQLGHAFENNSDHQVTLEVNFAFHYKLELAGDAKAGATDAVVGLKLFVRNSYSRALRAIDIANHSTEQGAVQRESTEQQSLSIPLGPGESVQIFVAATAAADTIKSERSAGYKLTIDHVRIDATSRSAPPVGTAPHDAK